jgi:hypothetical protein
MTLMGEIVMLEDLKSLGKTIAEDILVIQVLWGKTNQFFEFFVKIF